MYGAPFVTYLCVHTYIYMYIHVYATHNSPCSRRNLNKFIMKRLFAHTCVHITYMYM